MSDARVLTADEVWKHEKEAKRWRDEERAAGIKQIAAADTPPLRAIRAAHWFASNAVPELVRTARVLMEKIDRLSVELEITGYKLEMQRQINDGLAKALAAIEIRRPVIYIFPKDTLSAERLAQLREEGEVRGAGSTTGA